MSYVKIYARILGWTFVAIEVVGFFLTGFGGFFGMDGETLVLFGINPAHNLVQLILLAINQADNVLHLGVGALGIGVVAASARRGAQPAEA